MSKAPFMPMYWDAYLADTSHLTCEEHGAYLLLLAAMWRREGYVPDNDRDLARILRLTPAKWRKIRARLDPMLIVEDGRITQGKLREIWQKTGEKIDKNRANGARGGRPKNEAVSSENKDIEKPNGSVSVKRNESIPEPEPEPEPEYSVPYGTAAGKPGGLWDDGLKILKNSGLTDAKARAIIGDWCKRHGRDEVLSAVSAAGDAADPVAYVHTILKPKPSANVTLEDMERARAQSFRITDAGW